MQWILDRFAEAPNNIAFIHEAEQTTYADVISLIAGYGCNLKNEKVASSGTVAVVGDYSPQIFCLVLALALNGNIVIPIGRDSVVEQDSALSISGCDWIVALDSEGCPAFSRHVVETSNEMLVKFRKTGKPGLVLFSSGSTGTPKGILHDFERVASKFEKKRTSTVAIPFLMIDHFGGINTILAITSSLGTVVTVSDRSITSICRAIEDYAVELLPATPSFLTMLTTSNLLAQFDLTSLKRITFGTEVMPQATLDRLKTAFPGVHLQQTYGLSEVGVLASKSREDGSIWLKVGGEGFETRVVDDILWIRSAYAMVGYLNAPSEFDKDGWFNTQDRVEVEDEWVRILGRATDLINVGGLKVYPAEIENVILAMDNIADVAVFGEPHPLLGRMIVAKVVTVEPESAADLKVRIRAACHASLASYKTPSKVVLAEGTLYTSRQKKLRKL